MKRASVMLLALAMTSILRAGTGTSDPAATTKAAYQTAMTHFGFSPDTLKVEKPYFAPDLYKALLKKANKPVPKGDAPDIEGDLLLDCQDPPTHLEIGSASVDGTKADVHVTLHWQNEKRQYLVYMAQIDGSWKITDVDFGKDGKLTDLAR